MGVHNGCIISLLLLLGGSRRRRIIYTAWADCIAYPAEGNARARLSDKREVGTPTSFMFHEKRIHFVRIWGCCRTAERQCNEVMRNVITGFSEEGGRKLLDLTLEGIKAAAPIILASLI